MFGTSVELVKEMKSQHNKLQEKIEALQAEAKELRACVDKETQVNKELAWKLKIVEKENDLATEKKLADLRKSMQESLIKSDLLRTEALAKLEIYEKTDTKADANTIKDMIGQLIGTIGKQNVNVIK